MHLAGYFYEDYNDARSLEHIAYIFAFISLNHQNDTFVMSINVFNIIPIFVSDSCDRGTKPLASPRSREKTKFEKIRT